MFELVFIFLIIDIGIDVVGELCKFVLKIGLIGVGWIDVGNVILYKLIIWYFCEGSWVVSWGYIWIGSVGLGMSN